MSAPVPITEQEWASIAHLFDYNQGTETSGPGGAPTPPDLVNNLDGGVDVVDATCSIDGCERSPIARSLCSPHYARERRADVSGAMKTCQRCGATVFRAREGNWFHIDPCSSPVSDDGCSDTGTDR